MKVLGRVVRRARRLAGAGIVGTNIPLKKFVRREWGGERLSDAANYACGLKPISGWTNIDFFDRSVMENFVDTGVPLELSAQVYNFDLLAKHPFPNDCFQFAYCEDFIEHIDQKSSLLFLSEIYRTLRLGGVFRISTPCFDGVLQRHFRNASFDRVLEESGRVFDQWGHVHFYSHASLKSAALSLGFRGYAQCDYGVSSHERLCNLETRPEQIGLNLYAELTK